MQKGRCPTCRNTFFRILLAALLIAAFVAGSLFGHRSSTTENSTRGRRVLYYVDPMNPGHTSDKPGVAPCGMKMEPVYANTGETSGSAGAQGSLPPGTVHISAEKQQTDRGQDRSSRKDFHTSRVPDDR